MIIPMTYKNEDGTIEIKEHDTGVSFADLIPVCDIVGHETEMRQKIQDGEYLEKCMICMMERDVTVNKIASLFQNKLIAAKIGEWREGPPCYECESECIISMPLCNIKCPSCGNLDKNKHKINGLMHVNDDQILYDCRKCGKTDQVITKAHYIK